MEHADDTATIRNTTAEKGCPSTHHQEVEDQEQRICLQRSVQSSKSVDCGLAVGSVQQKSVVGQEVRRPNQVRSSSFEDNQKET